MSPSRRRIDVARHQFARYRVDPLSIPFHCGFGREFGLQRGNFVARLMFLPKCHHCIREEQKENDEEIQPVPDHARQNHRGFNHPRNGSPEIGEKLQESIGFLFRDLVRPVFRQPLLGFGLAEAVRR